MRILGLGLLTVLLLALIRFIFIQPDFQSFVGLRDSNSRLTHNLVSKLPAGSKDINNFGTEHAFFVLESDTWTALAGSPGYASASFNMPKEVAVVSGVLILDVRAELQTESVARLRVNVNGERRGEIILREGVNSNRIRINLLPSDMTQSQLHVTLAAIGAFPQHACRRDWNGGMIVRIDPTSRVELNTEGPLLDLNDRLRATGNPYQIQWPEQSINNDYERLVNFGVDQRLRDIRTEFVPANERGQSVSVAFSEQDFNQAAEIVENGVRETEGLVWPLMIAEEGPNSEAKFFEYETSWRHSYDLRTTPNAEYATAFELGLQAVGLQPNAEWLLSVTLNGGIILAERFTGDTLDINRKIDLPYNLQDFSNTIEIKLISSERQNKNECTSGSPITAHLKRSTALHGGVAAPDQSIGEFINALNGQLQLEVSKEINAAEASSAVAFLAETFGDRVRWDITGPVDREIGYVYVSTRSELRDRFIKLAEEWPDHIFWLVSPTLPDDGDLPYRQTELTGFSLLDFELNEGPRVAAIVAIKRSKAVKQPDTEAILAPLTKDTKTSVSEKGSVSSVLPNAIE